MWLLPCSLGQLSPGGARQHGMKMIKQFMERPTLEGVEASCQLLAAHKYATLEAVGDRMYVEPFNVCCDKFMNLTVIPRIQGKQIIQKSLDPIL